MPSSNSSAMQQMQPNDFVPVTHVASQSLTSTQSAGSPPELFIIEQPKQKMRFRYPTEKGNHGCLTGRNSKSFPTVRLENYNSNSDIYVRASLYTVDKKDAKPHFHTFKGQNCKDGICIVALNKESMTTTFENLKIEYYQKKYAESAYLKIFTENNSSNESLTALKQKAKKEVEKLNLSCVRIYFEAFHLIGSYSSVIAKKFSEPICHQNNPKCSDLKIVRIDKTTSPMKGDEEIFLLCDKVDKNDIEVKFYEYNRNGEIVWEENGQFNYKADVHHQYAIVFKTPPYTYEDNIKSAMREVTIQLFRPTDGQTSNPIQFRYIREDEDEQEISRKRKKISHFQDSVGTMGEFSGALNPSSIEYSPQLPSPPTQNVAYDSPGADGYSTSPSTSLELSDSDIQDIESLLCNLPGTCDIAQMNENTNFSINTIKKLSGNEQFVSSALISNFSDPPLSTTMPSTNQHLEEYNRSQSHFYFPDNLPSDMTFDSVPELKKPSERLSVDELHKEFINLNLSRESKCTSHAANKQKFTSKKTFTKTVQHYRTMTNEDGDNLLHLVVLHESNLRLLSIFIDALTDHLPELINKQNNLKQTPLHLAVMINCAQTVGVLLDHGSDLNIVDKKGNTPLHLAAKHNNVNCLKKIMDKIRCCKCTLNDTINFDGYTALQLSIMNQSENCVRLLIDAGANIWVKDGKSGRTALHMAVLYLPTVVKLLLVMDPYCATAYHNNLNTEDYEGNTALQLACINKLPEVAQLLRDVDTSPHLKNSTEIDGRACSASNNNQINDDTTEEVFPLMSSTGESKCDSHLSNPQCTLSQTDSGYISSNEISLVDNATIAKLEKLLNPPNTGWKRLAIFSGVDEKLTKNIAALEKESPTKAILRLLVKDGRTAEDLLNTLKFAELKEAYDVVKKY